MDKVTWDAAKAFIEFRGKILILRESPRYLEGTNIQKYDLVGGRLKPEESPLVGLNREIFEESLLRVTIEKDPFFRTTFTPIVRGENWEIDAKFYRAIARTDRVTLGKQGDHDDYQWIIPANFRDYPIIENLFPAFEAYLKLK